MLPPAEAAKRDDALVEEVNERWSGARCRLLFDIPIKKKTNSDGWSKSTWIVPAEGRKVRDGNLAALMWVSDRGAVPGAVLRAGTHFVAEGWTFKKPKSQEGLFLELRLEDSPVRARINFMGTFGKDLDVGDLRDMERWVRMDFFQISAADEGLVEVADPASAPPRPPPAAAVAAEGVELRVLGATTEPLSVAPGRMVVLAMTYEVSGLPPGGTVEVLERRAVVRDGRVLTTLEASVRRGPGTHRSTQSLTVPTSIEPGVLELRASIHAPGAESSGRALFQVDRP